MWKLAKQDLQLQMESDRFMEQIQIRQEVRPDLKEFRIASFVRESAVAL
jgi:hypothetical protein